MIRWQGALPHSGPESNPFCYKFCIVLCYDPRCTQILLQESLGECGIAMERVTLFPNLSAPFRWHRSRLSRDSASCAPSINRAHPQLSDSLLAVHNRCSRSSNSSLFDPDNNCTRLPAKYLWSRNKPVPAYPPSSHPCRNHPVPQPTLPIFVLWLRARPLAHLLRCPSANGPTLQWPTMTNPKASLPSSLL